MTGTTRVAKAGGPAATARRWLEPEGPEQEASGSERSVAACPVADPHPPAERPSSREDWRPSLQRVRSWRGEEADIRDPRERGYERGGISREHQELTESEGRNSSENVMYMMGQARSSVEQRREAKADRERKDSRTSSSDATRRDELRSEVSSQRESEGSGRASGEGSKRSYTSGGGASR